MLNSVLRCLVVNAAEVFFSKPFNNSIYYCTHSNFFYLWHACKQGFLCQGPWELISNPYIRSMSCRPGRLQTHAYQQCNRGRSGLLYLPVTCSWCRQLSVLLYGAPTYTFGYFAVAPCKVQKSVYL